jgi:hypothetical protein
MLTPQGPLVDIVVCWRLSKGTGTHHYNVKKVNRLTLLRDGKTFPLRGLSKARGRSTRDWPKWVSTVGVDPTGSPGSAASPRIKVYRSAVHSNWQAHDLTPSPVVWARFRV